jgi:hypothetical protein
MEERPECSRLKRANLTEDMPGGPMGTVMMLFPFSQSLLRFETAILSLVDSEY